MRMLEEFGGRVDGLTVCAICGCNELRACEPASCSWQIQDPPICSACCEFLQNVSNVWRAFAILRACGITRGSRAILLALGMVTRRRRRRRSTSKR